MSQWSADKLHKHIEEIGDLDLFHDIYGDGEDYQLALVRISGLLENADFEATHLFSAPGRTELGGNHTDHNLGRVVCAAVRHDTLAAVVGRDDGKIVIKSDGFSGIFNIDISDLNPRSSEIGKTDALIRGVLAGIKESGGEIGGFSAQVTSLVGVGSGLSSSASFEVLIGTIINNLYNDDELAPENIAQIGQFAENTYFGKPCGLMDQIASAVGGILSIDFKDPENLDIKKISHDFESENYVLLVVNTGSCHADLTPAYASIPQEMGEVAMELGAEVLGLVEEQKFFENITSIRSKLGDRAVLRALHFYHENKRVDEMVLALQSGEFDTYLKNVSASGASSQNILQNSIPPNSDGMDQGLNFALGLSQLFFEDKGRGVARVHGGGFAGTIQAYIHKGDIEEYKGLIKSILGDKAFQILKIRHHGATLISEL